MAAAANTVVCANCGRATPPGKFCRECGKPLIIAPEGMTTPRKSGGKASAAAPAKSAPKPSQPQAPPRTVAALPKPPARPTPAPAASSGPAGQKSFSVWWIIVPTLLFAVVVRNVPQTLVLAAIGAALHLAQARPEVPAPVKPYLPLLQSVVVFLFLGGSVIAFAFVAGAGFAAVKWHRELFAALEPWWQLQQRMTVQLRRVLAFVVSLLIGYNFGVAASGSEWTYTLLSIAVATVATFLLLFTPPPALRRRA